ncbi:HBR481Cp [Eremothecium sinecaudum]|uniref:HBR481Cp n=1 Tax=Eremothecium sinecaudum TaxID=45286 RepID=A0A120K1H3_9SACH|nr:HBR481Cp [Eremothecium sinecaudum]AMD19382.1 HBR481Cp [Eremothecium sinecaudum]
MPSSELDLSQQFEVMSGQSALIRKFVSVPSSTSTSSVEETNMALFDVRSGQSTSTSDNCSHMQRADVFRENCASEEVPRGSGIGGKDSLCGVEYSYDSSYDPMKDVMMWRDPVPAQAPSYTAVNPNTRITYPIFEQEEDNILPSYTPAVYDVVVVSVKQEWLTPYEPCISRTWRYYVMEINSTQLNFYDIDASLTKECKRAKPDALNKPEGSAITLSTLTKCGSFFSLHLGKEPIRMDAETGAHISAKVKKDRGQYLTPEKLHASYTLQYSKVGMPTDYTKKPYVLRLRCETEQFLVSFSNVDDLIMWHVYLDIGIGVSLDLDQREMPAYRTVPRRRRHNYRSHRSGRSNWNRDPMVSLGSLSRHPIFGRLDLGAESALIEELELGLIRDNASQGGSTMSFPSPTSGEAFSLTDTFSIRSSDSESSTTSIGNRLKHLFMPEEKKQTRVNRSASASTSFRARACSVNSLMSVAEDVNLDDERAPLPRAPSYRSLNSNNDASHRLQKNKLPLHSRDISSPTRLIPKIPFPNMIDSVMDRDPYNVCHNQDMTTGFSGSANTFPASLETNAEIGIENEALSMHSNGNRPENPRTSVYAEEDIDENSEDEFIFGSSASYYAMSAAHQLRYRNSSGSFASNLHYIRYERDDGIMKWEPPKKQVSRKKYIRDSLRCIKPLCEDEEWLGDVLVYSHNTNKSQHNYKRTGSFRRKNKGSWCDRNEDAINPSNRQLKACIVGPHSLIDFENSLA